jgi:hypothetical protein
MTSRKKATLPKRGYEVVFTVDEYYDGPRTGVANYLEKPHFYECPFSPKTGYSNFYYLTPIDEEVFHLALAAFGIWRKWELVFRTRKVANKSRKYAEDTKVYGQINRF